MGPPTPFPHQPRSRGQGLGLVTAARDPGWCLDAGRTLAQLAANGGIESAMLHHQPRVITVFFQNWGSESAANRLPDRGLVARLTSRSPGE